MDCHRHQALAVSQFVSLVRQTLSFTVPFFNPPLNDRVGYAGGFGIEASILAVFYSLVRSMIDVPTYGLRYGADCPDAPLELNYLLERRQDAYQVSRSASGDERLLKRKEESRIETKGRDSLCQKQDCCSTH